MSWHRSIAMRISSIALLVLTPLTAAQQVLDFTSGALPQCASSCANLINAQAVCYPPAAQVTNAQTYLSCFCQSAYLPNLRTDATASCGQFCTSQSDLAKISSWYTNTCATLANAAAAPAPGQATTTTAGSQSTTTAARGSSSTTAGAANTRTQSSTAHQTWWQGHWKWVVMIIVVIVLLLVIAIVAVLYRRYRRKKKDAIDGPFNRGITERSMATNPAAPAAYPQPIAGAERDTPSALGSIRRGDSRIASTTTLPRAARLSGVFAGTGGSDENIRHSRTINPETGAFDHNGKGKAMATVSEGEMRS